MMGLEGMVKLKNPDDIVVVSTVLNNDTTMAELNVCGISHTDSEKR